MAWSPESEQPQPPRIEYLQLSEEQREQLAKLTERGEANYLTLGVFTPEVRCVKCGHDKATCQHMQPRQCPGVFGTHEGILRICERCGFIWGQRCLDAEVGVSAELVRVLRQIHNEFGSIAELGDPHGMLLIAKQLELRGVRVDEPVPVVEEPVDPSLEEVVGGLQVQVDALWREVSSLKGEKLIQTEQVRSTTPGK